MDPSGTRRLEEEEQAWRIGHVIDVDDRWSFSFDAWQHAVSSSGRKRIFWGTFVDESRGTPQAARALAFRLDTSTFFGVECANLGLLSNLGVGPRLLGIAEHAMESTGERLAFIIEEDVGISLATILAKGASAHDGRPILHQTGTRERSLENAKVLYDVFVQVRNAHQAGIYHRDLRCENVCVQRFGDGPADVRATIIDFELGSRQLATAPQLSASLFDTLFQEVPSHLAGTDVRVVPNPLEVDMGYLAALHYHLVSGGLLLNEPPHTDLLIDDFLRFLDRHVPYFAYHTEAPGVYARHLNRAIDLEPLAGRLGLVPVSEDTFPSPQLLAHARAFHWPYLDSMHMAQCLASPESRLASKIDLIAHASFEAYTETQRSLGRPVRYACMEDQPADLLASCYAQAEHVASKVQALGYLIVSDDARGKHDEIDSLTEDQIEVLARIEHARWMEERLNMGWKLDTDITESDPERKLSPYLVPYDELPADIRAYDLNAARQTIDLVKSCGLKVVRPR